MQLFLRCRIAQRVATAAASESATLSPVRTAADLAALTPDSAVRPVQAIAATERLDRSRPGILLAGLLALAQAISVTERQLHRSLLNMGGAYLRCVVQRFLRCS